jgi:gliding motility-associated-like protein
MSHTLTIAACDNYTLNGQIYTTTGIYTQTFTNSAGCDSILTLDLTINNAITTSSTVAICSGQSAMIHGNNESTAGVYSQTFVAVGGCDSISTVTLTLNVLPDVTFFSDTNQGCSSLCVNFSTYEPGNYSFAWNFGDNSSSSLLNPSHCYTAEGEYNVQLIVTDANGCTDSLTIVNMITVHPSPVSQFATSVNETTILTPTIAFTDMSIGATSWRWSFGYNLHGTSTEHNPSYTYTDTGSYTIKQTVVNQYGCTDSSEQQITIKAAYAFYIPNAITPNNDGLNDEFIPMSTGMDIGNYELTIYNRWGNLLFKTNDPFQGWNARENSGNIVPQDIYTWKITTRDMFGKSHAYQGSVTVIR